MAKGAFRLKRKQLEGAKRALSADDFGTLNELDIDCASAIQKDAASGAAVTPARRAYLATYEAEGYINGDGFDAFFSYMDDEALAEVEPGYRLFGAPEFAALIRRAFEAVPGGQPPRTQVEREAAMEEIAEGAADPFEEVFEAFIEIGGATAQRIRYIVEHPDEFFEG
ncbi:MAG: DUF4375 domain-containing protein [Phycisphaeraceae bacterium]|nr:DUF4375 domain-containing protein [Phycisphaeraceae bacterium]